MVGDDMAWMGWSKSNESKFASIWGTGNFSSRRMYDDDDLGGRISLFLIDRFFFLHFHIASCSAFGHELYHRFVVFFERYSLD
jgi:hypothetical protein